MSAHNFSGGEGCLRKEVLEGPWGTPGVTVYSLSTPRCLSWDTFGEGDLDERRELCATLTGALSSGKGNGVVSLALRVADAMTIAAKETDPSAGYRVLQALAGIKNCLIPPKLTERALASALREKADGPATDAVRALAARSEEEKTFIAKEVAQASRSWLPAKRKGAQRLSAALTQGS